VAEPHILVLSSLFPSPTRPTSGVFIRERMFRVAKYLPILVLSPRPWFPGQGLLRLLRPGYRPSAPRRETQEGIDIFRPRFLALPGVGRWLDGVSMAACSYLTVRKLQEARDIRLIDAHFAHPDGEAAVQLGRWLGLPVTVTLRGTEVPHIRDARLRKRIARTLGRADHVFSVSESLRQVALKLGTPIARTEVVGNGIDIGRFQPMDKAEARRRLGLTSDARVLISVGALVERKGMHRVIDCLPELLLKHPNLHYLVVGGAGPEGDIGDRLKSLAASKGLAERVHFVGPVPPDELKWPLSAADIFVLATSNEGWANVFLEAMACGLPVVTTDVGGNREVVCRPDLGIVVPLNDRDQLISAIDAGLDRRWDRASIRDYATANRWDMRVQQLIRTFRRLMTASRDPAGNPQAWGKR